MVVGVLSVVVNNLSGSTIARETTGKLSRCCTHDRKQSGRSLVELSTRRGPSGSRTGRRYLGQETHLFVVIYSFPVATQPYTFLLIVSLRPRMGERAKILDWLKYGEADRLHGS